MYTNARMRTTSHKNTRRQMHGQSISEKIKFEYPMLNNSIKDKYLFPIDFYLLPACLRITWEITYMSQGISFCVYKAKHSLLQTKPNGYFNRARNKFDKTNIHLRSCKIQRVQHLHAKVRLI